MKEEFEKLKRTHKRLLELYTSQRSRLRKREKQVYSMNKKIKELEKELDSLRKKWYNLYRVPKGE